jgi:tRNA(Ile)-lysidine synthase
VSVPGSIKVAETGKKYTFELVKREDFNPDEGDLYLDFHLLPETLYLRSRRAGDTFKPQGIKGSKKIKKLFIDLKVPYFERDKVALLTGEDNEIYAVLGIGISRFAAISSDTRSILMIKMV